MIRHCTSRRETMSATVSGKPLPADLAHCGRRSRGTSRGSRPRRGRHRADKHARTWRRGSSRGTGRVTNWKRSATRRVIAPHGTLRAQVPRHLLLERAARLDEQAAVGRWSREPRAPARPPGTCRGASRRSVPATSPCWARRRAHVKHSAGKATRSHGVPTERLIRHQMVAGAEGAGCYGSKKAAVRVLCASRSARVSQSHCRDPGTCEILCL